MNKLTNRFLAAFVAVALLASVSKLTAATIVLGQNELLGTIFPGTPANANNATEQVRFLVSKYNLGIANNTVLGNNPADPQFEVYTLYRPTMAPSTLTAPVHETKVNTSNPVVNLNGMTYQYVLFFQASNAWVYYIGHISGFNSIRWGGDTTTSPVPSNWNGSQISHYSLFNGTPTTRVPENSTTLVLVGLSLTVLGLVARRRNR